MPVVQVALPVPLPRLFDYLLPADAPQPVAGARVNVPFGNRKMIGIVVGTRETSDLPLTQLKQIENVLDDEKSVLARAVAHPALGGSLLSLTAR